MTTRRRQSTACGWAPSELVGRWRHLWPYIRTVQPIPPLVVIRNESSVLLSPPNELNCTVAWKGPALLALPDDGETEWREFTWISHVKPLFGFTIVKEIGIASRSATRHEGAPPADTVTCPIPGRPSFGPSEPQTVTTGGEQVADAEGAVGDDADPPPSAPPLHALAVTARMITTAKPKQLLFITLFLANRITGRPQTFQPDRGRSRSRRR